MQDMSNKVIMDLAIQNKELKAKLKEQTKADKSEKIKCYGEDCILVTDNETPKRPILLLFKQDIVELNKEWVSKV